MLAQPSTVIQKVAIGAHYVLTCDPARKGGVFGGSQLCREVIQTSARAVESRRSLATNIRGLNGRATYGIDDDNSAIDKAMVITKILGMSHPKTRPTCPPAAC